MESGGGGSRASDLGARGQLSPKNLMRNVRCICYSEQKTLCPQRILQKERS